MESKFDEVKNLPEVQGFIKIPGRSEELLIMDTDFAHDRWMDVFHELQAIFIEDMIPYGSAQRILRAIDGMNWYGLEDVELCELWTEEDKFKMSQLGEIDE